MNNRNTATSSLRQRRLSFRDIWCCGPRALNEESGWSTAVLKDGVAAFFCVGVRLDPVCISLLGAGIFEDLDGGWRGFCCFWD